MKKRFISWNVNGIRAVLRKNFEEFFKDVNADLIGVQEIKCQKDQVDISMPGYQQFWNYAGKKGYSGTAVFTRLTPIAISTGLNIPETKVDPEQEIYEYSNELIPVESISPDEEDEDKIVKQMASEGRVLTLEYPEFFYVNVYTPNSQSKLQRLDNRQVWDKYFRNYLNELDEIKPVIVSGDLNVAHKEIDLKNPESNHKNAGFTDEEREGFSKLLDSGFTDSFRYFKPEVEDRYSWWSYRTRARSRNAGWRIDYFLSSDRYQDKLIHSEILDEVYGSDHCPIILEFK